MVWICTIIFPYIHIFALFWIKYFIAHLFTLSSNERLKSRKIIEQLFKEGKSFSHFPLRILYMEMEDVNSRLQSGFAVSTRNFKKAVQRNRIKRLMRETYRLQKNSLKEYLQKNKKSVAVFFIYTGKELPEYPFLFQKMGESLNKIENFYERKKTDF